MSERDRLDCFYTSLLLLREHPRHLRECKGATPRTLALLYSTLLFRALYRARVSTLP